ncbi:Gfo/Idh/MocA family protein [Agaribacterium haliotis]|uniref:Gfo/Idh/MocA family protein n=1 Tax=Agaribacterium haliotis TaxID=2013869 RepID=UPI000BB53B44|nr:Gfo/Idh/MocA family oxidoreductase [Agaribacterium haliotis]
MKKIRWGIVSSGRIARQFASDLQYVENAQLAAVAARRLSDAQQFSQDFNIAKAYEGYDALFNDEQIDAIYVASPHSFHFEHSKAALEAGKHVLCEKPLTISSEQCKALTDIASERGLLLMEAMWTYFLPALQKAKSWFDAGKIGQLKHIKIDFGYPMPYDPNSREYAAELAGGSLLDMGIYPLAICHYFSGDTLRDMYVRAHLADNGVDDDVVLMARSAGAQVNLASSFQCRLENAAYIIGDRGRIVIPDACRASSCFLYELDTVVEQYQDPRKSLGYEFEARHFSKLVLDKQLESPVMPHKLSLLLQTQMEQIKALF